jgi:hypothetical protein
MWDRRIDLGGTTLQNVIVPFYMDSIVHYDKNGSVVGSSGSAQDIVFHLSRGEFTNVKQLFMHRFDTCLNNSLMK